MSGRLDVPSVGWMMLRFALLKACLATAGFRRTLGWIHARVQRAPLRGDVDSARIADVEYAVALAAALYPGHAACLERSLLLYWHLRRAGVPVRFRMGVQMYPFLAHAWVEHDEQPINDLAEHVAQFRPIEGVAG
ncbi:MAG: lasso peptide biosynthesis B2 protein [Gemmatimonadaceae bacterium]